MWDIIIRIWSKVSPTKNELINVSVAIYKTYISLNLNQNLIKK